MIIDGIQKITLLDFPGHVACTVFLKGCNFYCPYCYNSSLIDNGLPTNGILEEDFFDFLKNRKGKLDGVAVTGGEPLLQKDIITFIEKIKQLGFKVKLDTNGSFPEKLSYLINNNLVDYVAMDIKNSYEKYHMTTCFNELSSIKKSVNILLNSNIDYEFRTTIVNELHNVEDFEAIGLMISGAKNYYLQSFQNKDSVLNKNLSSMSKEDLLNCLKIVQKYVPNAKIRGID